MRKTLIPMIVCALFVAAAWAGEPGSGQLVPNRLATAKVGEWAIYKIPDGLQQKLTVVERDGDGPQANITIRVDDLQEGKVVGTREITELAGEPMTPMPPPKDEGAVATLKETEMTVKGKTVKGVAIEVKKDGELLRTWYLSPELPVYGLVKRSDAKGVNDFEVLDFGGH